MPENKFPSWPLHVTLLFGLMIALIYSFGPLSAATGKHKTKDIPIYQIETSYRDELTEGTPARINLIVTSDNKPKEVKLAYYSLSRDEARPHMVFREPPMKKEFQTRQMDPAGNSGLYTIVLPPINMSEQYYFYFILVDEVGKSYNYPPNMPQGTAESIGYRREGVMWVTILHITFMFMVIFFMLHIIYYSLAHIGYSDFPIGKAIRSAVWANVFFFLTSFPIGCFVAWQGYGRPWTGLPVAWGLYKTDNKSLLIFVYWVIILLLIVGLSKGKNKITSKTYAWLSIIGAIGTLLVFVTGGHI